MKLRSTVLAASLAIAALAITAQASANCAYPTAPDKIPDGSKASKDEMIAGSQAVKAFDALIKQYQDCVQTEHDAAVLNIDPALPKDKKDAQKTQLDDILDKKVGAAQDDDEAVTGRFNAQIKAYNSEHAK